MLALISRNQMSISSINGIPSGEKASDDSVSHEKALTIIKNQKAFLKESRRFNGDETKIVISKKLFCNFLKNKKECNLFLITNAYDSKTTVSFNPEAGSTIEFIESNFWDWAAVITFVFGTFITVGFFANEVGAQSLLGMGLFILCLIVRFLRNRLVGKKKNSLKAPDFLLGGHDYPRDNLINKFSGFRKIIFSFSNLPVYSEMITTSIKLEARIGYIFRRSPANLLGVGEDEFSFDDLVCANINFPGPAIPVIILEHSIIFDTAYLQIINGRIFVNPPFPESHFETLKITREEWIPEINLSPKMFI